MTCTYTETANLAGAIASPTADHPYIEHLHRHRRMRERKPAVQAQYHYWYRMIADQMTDLSPSVELGCGCGNFKTFRPDTIATDAMATPWCDRVVDACNMPFEDDSIGNLIMFDILHHIPTPLRVFDGASRVLHPCGRIIIVEPLLTAWSRIVYHFHHEPSDETADLFDVPPTPSTSSADYANAATATLLFRTHRQAFLHRFPRLKLITARPFSCLAYPLTGGFQPFCLIPTFAVKPLSRIEDFLISRMAFRFLALRTVVTLEKRT